MSWVNVKSSTVTDGLEGVEPNGARTADATVFGDSVHY